MKPKEEDVVIAEYQLDPVWVLVFFAVLVVFALIGVGSVVSWLVHLKG